MTLLCKFFLSSSSFISSYTACITVLQLTQLRGNRRAGKQKETRPSVCLSVTRMRLQQTLNSSNMVNVGHGKQKPSVMVCGLRSFCHCLASCSGCVRMCLCVWKPQTCAWLYLTRPNLSVSRLIVFGSTLSCRTCLDLGRTWPCVFVGSWVCTAVGPLRFHPSENCA